MRHDPGLPFGCIMAILLFAAAVVLFSLASGVAQGITWIRWAFG